MSDEAKAKIWLVSEGEYSAYEVVAIFDDQHKEDAERFAKLIGGRVEEQPLGLNPTHQEPPSGQSFFQFQMHRNGKTTDIYVSSLLDNDGDLRKGHYRVWTHADRPHQDKSHWRMDVRMYARDEEHAVKVANEIRIQILAGAKPSEGSIP